MRLPLFWLHDHCDPGLDAQFRALRGGDELHLAHVEAEVVEALEPLLDPPLLFVDPEDLLVRHLVPEIDNAPGCPQ